jgi:hypothetical protein
MIELQYGMTYEETIAGPLGSTSGSPLGERLCGKVVTARLHGERIDATLAMPGVDLMRVSPDGLRRPDLRAELLTDDGELILFRCARASSSGVAGWRVPARSPTRSTASSSPDRMSHLPALRRPPSEAPSDRRRST